MPEELPDRLEAGTHNVPGIAGLLAGIRYLSAQGVENIERRERRGRVRLRRRLGSVRDRLVQQIRDLPASRE